MSKLGVLYIGNGNAWLAPCPERNSGGALPASISRMLIASKSLTKYHLHYHSSISQEVSQRKYRAKCLEEICSSLLFPALPQEQGNQVKENSVV